MMETDFQHLSGWSPLNLRIHRIKFDSLVSFIQTRSDFAHKRVGSAGSATVFSRFNQIWRPKIPTKIKVLSWLVSRERLVTRSYRARWAPNDSTICPLCSAGPETMQHLFCECAAAMEFWVGVGVLSSLVTPFTSLEELWDAGAALKRSSVNILQATISQSIIPADNWTIWRARNDLIFKGTRVYQENMRDFFCRCVKDRGRTIAKAEEVSFRKGRLITR